MHRGDGATMSLGEYVAVVRLRYRVVLAVTLAAVLGAAGVLQLITPMYTARTTVVLAVAPDLDIRRTAGEAYTVRLLRSCLEVARRPVVLAPGSTGAEAGSVEVRSLLGSSIIEIRVSHPVPSRAAVLADTFADRTAASCDDLLPPAAALSGAVDFETSLRARLPDESSSPRRTLTMVVGLGLGLFAGIAAAIALEAARPLARRRGVFPRGGAPVLGVLAGRAGRRQDVAVQVVDELWAVCRVRGARSVVLASTGLDPEHVADRLAAVLGEARGERPPRASDGGPGSPALGNGARAVDEFVADDLVLLTARAVLTDPVALELAVAADAVVVVEHARSGARDVEEQVRMLTMAGACVVGVVLADRGQVERGSG